MRRDWSTCGRSIVTGTSGKTHFYPNPLYCPSKKAWMLFAWSQKTKEMWMSKVVGFSSPLSFHDAVNECLKSKQMVYSQLTRAWVPQRCRVPQRHPWVTGSISPPDTRIRPEAPWHRGHCWHPLPVALRWLTCLPGTFGGSLRHFRFKCCSFSNLV